LQQRNLLSFGSIGIPVCINNVGYPKLHVNILVRLTTGFLRTITLGSTAFSVFMEDFNPPEDK